MIYEDSLEFYAALMKWFRHEHPEYAANGKTMALTPTYYMTLNGILSEYKMKFIEHRIRARTGYYFENDEDRLFFRIKWGNGTDLYKDI